MSHHDNVKKHAKRALSVGVGIAQLIGEQVGSVVKHLEQEGYLNQSEGKKLAREALSDANAFQKKLSAGLDRKVRGVVKSAGTKSKSATRRKKAGRSRKRK